MYVGDDEDRTMCDVPDIAYSWEWVVEIQESRERNPKNYRITQESYRGRGRVLRCSNRGSVDYNNTRSSKQSAQ